MDIGLCPTCFLLTRSMPVCASAVIVFYLIGHSVLYFTPGLSWCAVFCISVSFVPPDWLKLSSSFSKWFHNWFHSWFHKHLRHSTTVPGISDENPTRPNPWQWPVIGVPVYTKRQSRPPEHSPSNPTTNYLLVPPSTRCVWSFNGALDWDHLDCRIQSLTQMTPGGLPCELRGFFSLKWNQGLCKWSFVIIWHSF